MFFFLKLRNISNMYDYSKTMKTLDMYDYSKTIETYQNILYV